MEIQSPLGNWWWTIDRVLLGAIALVAMVGVMLVLAASPGIAENRGFSSYHFIIRHLVWLSIGVGIMVGLSMMSPTMIRRIGILGFLGAVVLLIAVKLFGPEINGAQRWLFIGGFSIQPSEYLKPCFAIVTAWILYKGQSQNKFPGYIISGAVYFFTVGLLLLQPDFGMTVLITAIWGGQLFLAGLPMFWVGLFAGLGVGGIVSAYLFFPHVAQRINTFLDPSAGDNYQVEKSLEAIIEGGILGKGPGEGTVKDSIPDAHTDFIFAVAAEEYGLLVSLLVMLLFAFVVFRGFTRIYQEPNFFVMIATAGLLIQFSLQTIINMSVALKLLPNTGMTLPLVSYGGSSTLAISILLGMMLGFTRKRYDGIKRKDLG